MSPVRSTPGAPRAVKPSVATVSLLAAALFTALLGAAPAHAVATGDDPSEPPGLQDRETHMTMLTTQETDCTEVFVRRAVTVEGARALVPERYQLATTVSGDLTFATFVVWDYVCESFSVDGQQLERRTHISFGAIALSGRDQVPLPGNNAFYLVDLRTDNPVLTPRYRQLGLPATFTPELVATVSDPSASPFEVSFTVPGASYTTTAVTESAPAPVPVAGGGARLFHEGHSGEVLLSYENSTGSLAAPLITADYRQYELLVPIIALPRLLQINGVRFNNALIRGDWEATVVRLH